MVAGAHLYDAQWSPDGQSIAFLRGGTLVVRQLATGAETPVAYGAFADQWSPDGRWIAYLTIRIDRHSVGRGTVDVVSRDGTQRHEIEMLHKPEAPVWGPGHRRSPGSHLIVDRSAAPASGARGARRTMDPA